MKWLKEILDSETEDKAGEIQKELAKHFIPKDKFNEVNDKVKEKEAELAEATKQLEATNGQVANLAKASEENEGLQAKLEAIGAEYEQFKSDADVRLANVKKVQAVERGLRDANANPETIDLLIGKFNLDSVELDDKDNIKDWTKHLEPIKAERKSLFGEMSFEGDKPADGQNTTTHGFQAQYNEAMKQGRTQEAISIKLSAANAGEYF